MEYMVYNQPLHISLCIIVTNVSLSFPTIAIRVNFSLPFGEKGYTVKEQDKYLDVCIRVASTGSHEKLQSSVVVIITFEDQSTTGMHYSSLQVSQKQIYIPCTFSGGEDYSKSLDQIGFPRCSVKGDRCCSNITIVDDELAEMNEKLFIKAQVYVEDIANPPTSGCGTGSGSNRKNRGPDNSCINRGSSVNVGRALNSSTGSISVTIMDNDANGKCAQSVQFSALLQFSLVSLSSVFYTFKLLCG